MNIHLPEKISIGYTCCGESYKKSLKKKLEEVEQKFTNSIKKVFGFVDTFTTKPLEI